ncbi:hypothetical protein JTB14_033115 [Gonioctena quinquepunctata]|nr:hypothetical protein JTB14_033115 [Gonioctena quinquepunctata]
MEMRQSKNEAKPESVVCRLCLDWKPPENCEKLQEVMREILESLNLNLIPFENPMICLDCSNRLKNTFNFKSIYIYTEDFLFPYINTMGAGKLDLQQIFWNKKNGQECTSKHRDTKICRLCLEPSDNTISLRSSDESILETFTKSLPEVAFNISNDPLICEECYGRFKEFREFLLDVSNNEKELITCHGLSTKLNYKELYKFDLPDSNENSIKKENGRLHNISIKKVDRIWNCDQCSFSSRTKYGLERHTVVHLDPTGEKLYKCQKCPLQTNQKYYFKNHVRIVHSEVKLEKFKCSLCKYESNQKDYLRAHVLRKHENPSKQEMLKCKICSYKTHNKTYLHNHLFVHKGPSEIPIYYCGTCDYKSKYKDKVARHELLHKDISEVPTFDCHLCAHKTREKRSLEVHLLTHKNPTEAEMFHCDRCTFTTKHKQSLRVHKANVHLSRKKSFKCNECHSSYKSKTYLLNHMRRCHVKTDMHHCSSCDYKTNIKSNLKQHINRRHNENITWFGCDQCSFKTKLKGNLTHHMRIHENIPEDEMHKCVVCPFKTIHKSSLGEHLKRHIKGAKKKLKKEEAPTDSPPLSDIETDFEGSEIWGNVKKLEEFLNE